MDFTEPDDFAVIRTEVRRLCDKYGNEYWRGLEPDTLPGGVRRRPHDAMGGWVR